MQKVFVLQGSYLRHYSFFSCKRRRNDRYVGWVQEKKKKKLLHCGEDLSQGSYAHTNTQWFPNKEESAHISLLDHTPFLTSPLVPLIHPHKHTNTSTSRPSHIHPHAHKCYSSVNKATLEFRLHYNSCVWDKSEPKALKTERPTPLAARLFRGGSGRCDFYPSITVTPAPSHLLLLWKIYSLSWPTNTITHTHTRSTLWTVHVLKYIEQWKVYNTLIRLKSEYFYCFKDPVCRILVDMQEERNKVSISMLCFVY